MQLCGQPAGHEFAAVKHAVLSTNRQHLDRAATARSHVGLNAPRKWGDVEIQKKVSKTSSPLIDHPIDDFKQKCNLVFVRIRLCGSPTGLLPQTCLRAMTRAREPK